MDDNDVLKSLRDWQSPTKWRIAFDCGAKYQDARSSSTIARSFYKHNSANTSGERLKKRVEESEHQRDLARSEVVKLQDELSTIISFLRQRAPNLLSLVPPVDFFERPTTPPEMFAGRMLELEGELLRALQAGEGNQSSGRPRSVAIENRDVYVRDLASQKNQDGKKTYSSKQIAELSNEKFPEHPIKSPYVDTIVSRGRKAAQSS